MWRWSQQYQAQLTGQALPEMMELIDWLKNHIPSDDADPSAIRISHGDYRWGSMFTALPCKPYQCFTCYGLCLIRHDKLVADCDSCSLLSLGFNLNTAIGYEGTSALSHCCDCTLATYMLECCKHRGVCLLLQVLALLLLF